MRPAFSTLATVAATLALTACGNDSSSSKSEAEEHAGGSAATALAEVGETRDALTAALATYKGGDKAAAEDQVAEAYVSHFEEVEGPLEERDHELNEELEEAISGELRSDMKAGEPAAEIETKVKSIVADLDKAEALLK
jgi:high-affinity iron transporter